MATTSPEIAAQAVKIDRESVGEKVRVHTVAKQLGIRATDFLAVLADHGIEGKKTASTLTKAQVFSVLDALSSSGQPSQPNEKVAETEVSEASEEPKEPAKKTTAKKVTKNAAKKAAKKTAKKSAAKKAAKKSTEKQAEEVAEQKPAKKSTKKTAKRTTKKSVNKPAEKAVEKPNPVQQESPEAVADTAPEAAAVVAANAAAEDKSENRDEDAGKKSSKRPAKRTAKRTAKRVVKKSTQRKAEEPAKTAEPEQVEPEVPEGDDKAPVSAENTEQPTRRRRVRRVVRRVGSVRQAEMRASKNKNHAKRDGKKQNKAEEVAKVTAPEDLHPAERSTEDLVDEPVKLKGSTRLESQRRWRAKNRDKNYKAITRAEFLARRESVERTMIVRDSQRTDHKGMMTQVGVVEDGQLVEHFVADATHQSLIGNVYLGRVQNVLGSMEAAFVDIGTGRNAVLYAGEMDWRSPHLHSKNRKIDQALRPGDQILVQVLKDPIGHKGARLTNRISFAGRYLVFFPAGTTAGISRKLPVGERKRLKDILGEVIAGDGGAIIRTAAENATEEQITEDVQRLQKRWEEIRNLENKERESKGAKPVTLYEEPNMLIQVVRDVFNADFSELVIDGDKSWKAVRDYLGRTSPELMERVHKWNRGQHDGQDAFAPLDLDQQLEKAMARKVWLPSGGYLVIDHTEAMTVIDVNTGSFVGSGGNLEATVTENNLEAAEEIVRQLRLRDIGGMIVVDFIDMLLQQNQDLVLRRLSEFLGRDRTRHKLGEVTSLGLVQLTRKRLGTGLLETFSTPCEACDGRGFIMHSDPVEQQDPEPRRDHGRRKERQQAKNQGKRRDDRRQEDKRREEKQDSRRDQGNQRAPQHEQGTNEQGANEQSTGRRRVRRRVVRRGNPHASQATEDINSIVASARKRSAQEDPDEPSAADNAEKPERAEKSERAETPAKRHRRRRVVRSASSGANAGRSSRSSIKDAHVSDDQPSSYEEAKRQFDESPRRKRRTRGNSKSDFAPRREDFEGSGNGGSGNDGGGDRGRDAGAESGAQNPRSRGRRRRVVRKKN
ncbi:Rne/Rng family ribonuclease [Corynebacterium macclintockiae]|uniref:Rne/Rng family ribonuclease n=1 Tax=Corynebacterium macclintockiae TaxID=2913501 RepID=UPI003EBD38E1